MKQIEYILEIFRPESVDDVWVTFNSSSPFMPISVGDIINPRLWPGSEPPQKVLRVLNVEHIIWELNDTVKHKMLIFTDEVAGTWNLRKMPA
ncbi:MAG: hypothetical protein ABSG44_10090 [Thermodesulfobacteriota bacterium]|jgi:hypothetical protein